MSLRGEAPARLQDGDCEAMSLPGDLKRTKCPDCPDGQVWDRKGPTEETCPTCGGEAFVWTEGDEEDTNVEDSYAR